jgi:MraZ protein
MMSEETTWALLMSSAGTEQPPAAKGDGKFVGNFTHSLDPKRRITIPAEWRIQAGSPESMYVMPGIHDVCLYVLTNEEMDRRLEPIRKAAVSDEKARQFVRILASRSERVSFDIQGRIRVKDDLLSYASLTNEVALVGAFEWFELWAPDRWKASCAMDQAALVEAAKAIGF